MSTPPFPARLVVAVCVCVAAITAVPAGQKPIVAVKFEVAGSLDPFVTKPAGVAVANELEPVLAKGIAGAFPFLQVGGTPADETIVVALTPLDLQAKFGVTSGVMLRVGLAGGSDLVPWITVRQTLNGPLVPEGTTGAQALAFELKSLLREERYSDLAFLVVNRIPLAKTARFLDHNQATRPGWLLDHRRCDLGLDPVSKLKVKAKVLVAEGESSAEYAAETRIDYQSTVPELKPFNGKLFCVATNGHNDPNELRSVSASKVKVEGVYVETYTRKRDCPLPPDDGVDP